MDSKYLPIYDNGVSGWELAGYFHPAKQQPTTQKVQLCSQIVILGHFPTEKIETMADKHNIHQCEID